MKMKNITLGFIALAALTMPSLADAHHSFAMFDRTKVVSQKGVVREFQWTNPHSWIQLIVTDASGKTAEWSLEALSPNVLGRWGWKRNSLKPGDKITAYFNPIRDGSRGGNMVKVTFADGHTIGGGQ